MRTLVFEHARVHFITNHLENHTLVIGLISWSTMEASVAPRLRVMLQIESATVMSFFVPGVPSTKLITSKSEAMCQPIWSTKEAQSPANWGVWIELATSESLYNPYLVTADFYRTRRTLIFIVS